MGMNLPDNIIVLHRMQNETAGSTFVRAPKEDCSLSVPHPLLLFLLQRQQRCQRIEGASWVRHYSIKRSNLH